VKTQYDNIWLEEEEAPDSEDKIVDQDGLPVIINPECEE
jgi:hypothetical protein